MPIKGIVLDLDETLIHGEFHGNKHIVHKRPHLKAFLAFLFANFKVGIWTHASIEWAKIVIDEIFTQEQKKQIAFLYSIENTSHRIISDKLCHIKSLHRLLQKKSLSDFKLSNVLILEDNETNCVENMNNMILLEPFTNQKVDPTFIYLKNILQENKNKTPKQVTTLWNKLYRQT